MSNIELYNYLKNSLLDMPFDSSERLFFARKLFSLITGKNKQDIVLKPDVEIVDTNNLFGSNDSNSENPDSEFVATISSIIKRIGNNEPLEYIFNKAEFMDLIFKTNSCVLIPRPETEELVSIVLNYLKTTYIDFCCDALPNRNSPIILDIGTGSGCIPIAICKNFPNAEFFACDISISALNTAKENAMLNDCKINFVQCDILDIEMSQRVLPKKCDVIISNPPYVLDSEKSLMHSNVLDYEPHNALFVPDSDPLIFYKRIAEFSAERLNKNGRLFFEINEKFGKETATLLKNCGFCNVLIIKDLFSKDRFVVGTLPSI